MINRIRREHPALQFNDALRFHGTDNDQLIAYSKTRPTPDGPDVVVVVVNLDPHHAQSGWVTLDLGSLGLSAEAPYVAHDLLSDAQYVWEGSANFVKLHPSDVPCHILSLSQRTAPSKPVVGP